MLKADALWNGSSKALSQTVPGKNGFVLKEKTLKLAKPVLFLLRIPLTGISWVDIRILFSLRDWGSISWARGGI